MAYFKALFLSLVLVSCPQDCNTPTSGDIPPPPVVGNDPEPDPPFNPGPRIDLRGGDIFSAFALNSRDEQTQRQVLRSAARRGYSIARVCVELQDWNSNIVFAPYGPYLAGDAALEAYSDLLKVAADEDMSLLVMGICTKLRYRGTDAERESWARAIGKRTVGYKNVAIEIVNEADHTGSVVSAANLNRMMKIIRVTAGVSVGSDQNLGARFDNTARYRYDYRWASDFPSFHPWRNPDPTASDIRDIVRENGGYAVLSETTSWTADAADLDIFGRLVTTSKEQIQRYMDNCNPNQGCVFCFHSIEGLLVTGPFSWMPQRRR